MGLVESETNERLEVGYPIVRNRNKGISRLIIFIVNYNLNKNNTERKYQEEISNGRSSTSQFETVFIIS